LAQHPCPTCGQPFPANIWRFDYEAAQLLVDGRAIHLTPHEAAIIGTLLKSFGKPIHRDRFFVAMYGIREPNDAEGVFQVCMHRLKRKLKPTRLKIINHWHFGYSITIREG
jgi:DNA-binding response OmpR family regulator